MKDQLVTLDVAQLAKEKGIKSISELPPYNNVHGYDYTTYEEALEQGLLEALKLIN